MANYTSTFGTGAQMDAALTNSPTSDQKAALTAANSPSGSNAFTTVTAVGEIIEDKCYKQLTADITYYVDESAGSDSNDGLSAGNAFETMGAALALVPKSFAAYSIYIRIIGNYTSAITVYQTRATKTNQRLIIIGDTEAAASHSVPAVYIYGCESIQLQHVTITSSIDIRNSNAIYIMNVIFGGTARTTGILAIDSMVSVRDTDFGTDLLENGIQLNRGQLTVQTNTGSCTHYGVYVGIGGQIIGNKDDGIPSGAYRDVYGGITHNYNNPMSLNLNDVPLTNTPTIRALNTEGLACIHGLGTETISGSAGSEVIWDGSNNNRHGANVGCTHSTSYGLYSAGFQLDENDYLELDSNLNDVDIATGSFTFGIRVKPSLTSLGANNYRFLFDTRHFAQVYRYNANWRFRWYNTAETAYSLDIPIADEEWQTVFYVYDSSNNKLTGYVFYDDGSYETDDETTTGTIRDGTGSFRVGCDADSLAGWLNSAHVDDFVLFRRVLSADECRNIHEGGIQFDDVLISKVSPKMNTISEMTTDTGVTIDGVLIKDGTVSTSPTISSGSGAPSSTPDKIGDIYVDISTPALYFAKGTSSSADWVAS